MKSFSLPYSSLLPRWRKSPLRTWMARLAAFWTLAKNSSGRSVVPNEKDYKDYPVSLGVSHLHFGNAGNTFAIQNCGFPLVCGGRGKARGVEFFLEKKFTDKWYGQLNVAYAPSRHAALDGIYRRGSFDSPVIFNAVGGYRLSPKWEASARWVFVTGRPYTPLNLPLSTAQNRAVLDTALANAVRAPDYFRLDFRVDRTFQVRGKPLSTLPTSRLAGDRCCCPAERPRWSLKTPIPRPPVYALIPAVKAKPLRGALRAALTAPSERKDDKCAIVL